MAEVGGMNEQWLPVHGYESSYLVSDQGRVWSNLSDRILKQYLSPVGYYTVGLRGDGVTRTWCVHRLVAGAFLGGSHGGDEVRHGNGVRTDNRASNLSWGSRADNMRDAVQHGTHFQSSKTHCKHGHEFTPDNTITNDRGHRRCRTCTTTRYAKEIPS